MKIPINSIGIISGKMYNSEHKGFDRKSKVIIPCKHGDPNCGKISFGNITHKCENCSGDLPDLIIRAIKLFVETCECAPISSVSIQ